MIRKETWYREALDVELQRALHDITLDFTDPQGQDAFERLKKIYLRTGKLPEEIREVFYKWTNYKVNSGNYDPEDLRVIWGGTAGDRLPSIPVEAVFKTPESLLPRMDLQVVFTTTVWNFSEVDPEEYEPDEHKEDINLSLKGVLERMKTSRRGWGKWWHVGGGGFKRYPISQSGYIYPGGFEKFVQDNSGKSDVMWLDEYASIELSGKSQEDRLMDLLFLKGPGSYASFLRWFQEMGVLNG